QDERRQGRVAPEPKKATKEDELTRRPKPSDDASAAGEEKRQVDAVGVVLARKKATVGDHPHMRAEMDGERDERGPPQEPARARRAGWAGPRNVHGGATRPRKRLTRAATVSGGGDGSSASGAVSGKSGRVDSNRSHLPCS